MKQIFEPVKMNHIELRNRLIRSATWEGIANPNGGIAEESYEIYSDKQPLQHIHYQNSSNSGIVC